MDVVSSMGDEVAPQLNTLEVNDATVDVKAIIAERDHLLEILIQRDITIELLLSKRKTSDAQSLKVLSERRVCAVAQKQLGEKTSSDECQKLRHECSVLRDLNNSLVNSNGHLKMVNKILQNNYDSLRKRLETVQTEHQSSLSQIHKVSQWNKAIASSSAKKRIRFTQPNGEPQNKRQRCIQTRNASNVVRNGSDADDADTESSDSDQNDDDHNNDDDVILVDNEQPIVTVSDDENENSDESLSEDKSFDRRSSFKPLSEYLIVKKNFSDTVSDPRKQKDQMTKKDESGGRDKNVT